MLLSQSPINEWKGLRKADNCDEVFSITATSKAKVQGMIKWPMRAAAVMHGHARCNIRDEMR